MKSKNIVLPVIIAVIAFLAAGCQLDDDFYGDSYKTNGFLEGTIWERDGIYLSFSKNAITVSRRFLYHEYAAEGYCEAGTYRSYFEDGIIYIENKYLMYSGSSYYMEFYFNAVRIPKYDGYVEAFSITFPRFISNSSRWAPIPGQLVVKDKYSYLNGFITEETEGELTVIEYGGNQKNLTIPSDMAGIPVTVIGNGEYSPFSEQFQLYLQSIVIPDSVMVINGGVFRARYLSYGSNTYLSKGITIGANVYISENNFNVYDNEHTGYWQNMGFVKFYNENGRKAGRYTWTYTYQSPDRLIFNWSWTPLQK